MLFKKKGSDATEIIQVSNLPILILDEVYNVIFKQNKTSTMIELENEIRNLLKEQGALNAEYDKLGKTKKIRFNKILNLSGEIGEKDTAKKMGTNKELVEHINTKLKDMKERLEELPKIIEKKNIELFNEAVKLSYNNTGKLYQKIKKLDAEVEIIRTKLKAKNDELKKLEDEYKEKSVFLDSFIGKDGINYLNKKYDGNIK